MLGGRGAQPEGSVFGYEGLDSERGECRELIVEHRE